MWIEFVSPVAASVFITLLLRKLDRSNLNLRKLKTVVDRGKKELQEISIEKKEELKDTTARFDLMILESEKFLSAIKERLEDSQRVLSKVESGRENLSEIGKEMQTFENITASVKDQLNYIHNSLEKIDSQQKKVKKIQEQLHQIDSEAAQMIKTFQQGVAEKSQEMIGVLDKKLEQIAGKAFDAQQRFSVKLQDDVEILRLKLQGEYTALEETLRQHAQESSREIEQQLHGQQQKLHELDERIEANQLIVRNRLPEMILEVKESVSANLQKEEKNFENFKVNLSKAEENFRRKVSEIREEAENQKTLLFQDLYQEAENIRMQVKELDLDALAKKDELLKATRAEASKIQEKINDFDHFYKNAQKTLYTEASEREQKLLAKIEKIENDSENLFIHFEKTRNENLALLERAVADSVASVEKKSNQVFEDSYRRYLGESQELRKIYDEIRASVLELEDRADNNFETLQKNAQNLQQGFGEDVIRRQQELEREFENRLNKTQTKLTQIEKNIIETQDSLMNKWQSDAKNLLHLIEDKELELKQSSEKWESRINILVNENKEFTHNSHMELEASVSRLKSEFKTEVQDQISTMKENSRDLTSATEIKFQEVFKSFKSKTEEKEELFYENMKSLSERFHDMKRTLESKQNSLFAVFEEEKSRSIFELKQQSESQLQLFNDEILSNAENWKKKMFALSDESLRNMRTVTGEHVQRFMAVKDEAEETFDQFQKAQSDVMSSIIEETRKSSDEILRLRDEMHDLKQEAKTIDQAKANLQTFKEAASDLENKLMQVEHHSATLQELGVKVDSLKDLRLKLDSEIMAMAQKREKIDRLEEQLQLILNLKEEVESSGINLEKVKTSIDEILQRNNLLDEKKAKVDALIEDFIEQHRLIESAIAAIESQENNLSEVKNKIDTLNSILHKIDVRSQSMRDEIGKIDNQLLSISKRENEIQDLKQKFLEIEDLVEDIDKRKDQIMLLRKSFEDLRKDMNGSMHQIQNIVEKADSKVKTLSDFINAVEPQISIAKNVDSTAISNDKKEVVLKLGQLGWNANEIANRINLDLGTIQTILATYG